MSKQDALEAVLFFPVGAGPRRFISEGSRKNLQPLVKEPYLGLDRGNCSFLCKEARCTLETLTTVLAP